MVKTVHLFSLDKSLAGKYLEKCEYPFEILPSISAIIEEIGKTLSKDEYTEIKERVPQKHTLFLIWNRKRENQNEACDYTSYP